VTSGSKVALGVVLAGLVVAGGYVYTQRVDAARRRSLVQARPHVPTREGGLSPLEARTMRAQLAELVGYRGALEGAWRGENDPAHPALVAFLSVHPALRGEAGVEIATAMVLVDDHYRGTVDLPPGPAQPPVRALPST